MTRTTQPKAEKQMIDAKVAKVREVVRNLQVSNNDIVLALHNFEMDVDRTIGAFVDGGVETALGSWEKCNTTTKKKKGNAVPAENSSAATSTTTETPKVSSVHASIPSGRSRKPPQAAAKESAKPANPKPAASLSDSFAKLSEDERFDELERLMREVNVKSGSLEMAIENAKREKSAVVSAIMNALKHRERQLDSYLEKADHELQETLFQQRLAYQRVFQENSPRVVELPSFVTTIATFDSWLQQNFTIHMDKTVKAIEKLGAGFCPATPDDVPPAKAELNGQPKIPQPNGKSAGPISNGNPETAAAKLVNGTDIKHSVSQTSLVSSVGEDSGLGQISPVYQEKHPIPVADSGILQSDGLSADQLANLQLIIQQNLEAKGINADMIKGIIGDGDLNTVRRRNVPRRDGHSNGGGKPKQNGKSSKPIKAGP